MVTFYNDNGYEYKEVIETWINENVPGSEFIVCDEDGREELVRQEIEYSAWAFNSWFILQHSSSTIKAEHLTRIQEDDCEGCNDFVLDLIDDFDSFVEDAVSSDGYGHFLNRYDGEEYELDIDNNTYYIYATN